MFAVAVNLELSYCIVVEQETFERYHKLYNLDKVVMFGLGRHLIKTNHIVSWRNLCDSLHS